jgi:lauroyl/myristoyl acyltransferase
VNKVKFNKKRLGLLLLGIWLIMTGLLQVVSVPIPAIGKILALLAIAAGALIVLDR